MAKFEKGTKVINVNTQEKGVVIEILPLRRGKQHYSVAVNGQELIILESSLIEDVNLSDPFEKLQRNIFSTFDDFLQSNTSFKIQNTSHSNISTLKSSKTIFKAYQFKPLLKFLNSGNRRLLVADEVGLGKTIEAGHIMLELKARKELRTVLIVCPISLQKKWQEELEDKFNLKFKIFDNMNDLTETFRTQYSVYGIVNYEKMRKPKDDKKKPHIIDVIQKKGRSLDLLICDEAHRLRNSSTQAHKGLKEIINYTKGVLFLTATPIMISRENLFNLLRLLDETEYNSYPMFENSMRVNQPFLTALSRLNDGDNLKDIAKELAETEVRTETMVGDWLFPEIKTIEERFTDIPLYSIIMDNFNKADSHENRVQLQFDISSLSKMNNIFSRTRKREVTQDWSQTERNPQTKVVTLNPDEREYFDMVIDSYIQDNSYTDEYGCDVMTKGGSLGLVQKKRQVASSVYAYMNDADDLLKGIDRYKNFPDAKVDKLLEIIDEVVNKHNKKLIVFALFRKTLNYLNIRLRNAGVKCVMIHGGTENRVECLEDFKNSAECKILLSSEVGSEGLDMQFCDAMVNYDLPWNPMVVEQRIGRIDRFGQQSPKVNIYNLVVEGSIQEQIYQRLLERIGIFKGSIGDLEAILDRDLESHPAGINNLREYFSSLEKELYTTQLTKEERDRKIDEIAKAALTEQKNAEVISEELTNALTNDISFKNEIERILNRKQYVTETELVSYIRYLCSIHLTTCRLETVNEHKGIYRFCMPKSDSGVLTRFLNEYSPETPDLVSEYASFKNRIRDEYQFEMTFNQETAYMNKRLIFVNAYHPIILSALKCFSKLKESQTDNTFKYAIHTDLLENGNYCLALYELQYKHVKYGQEQVVKTLMPLLYDYQKNDVIADTELAKVVLGLAQDDAILSETNLNIDNVTARNMKIDLADAMDKIDTEIFTDQQRRAESVKLLDRQRTVEHFDSQIAHQERIIRDNEYVAANAYDKEEAKKAQQILPAQRGRLANLKDEKEYALQRLEKTELQRMSPYLISLSQITII